MMFSFATRIGRCAAAAIVALLFVEMGRAAVTLPRVISSHMVLQRDAAVPIWGRAEPGEKITVKFRDQTKTATADAQGDWLVKLDPMKAGQPTVLTVQGANILTLTDVLVGEVWVGSGQSNMDSDVYDYTGNDPPLKAAAGLEHSQIRIYRSDVGNGWQQADLQTLRRFSAQLFYFAYTLEKKLNVPVGVMEGAIRGSPAANWISADVVASDPDIQKAIADHEKWHPHADSEKRWQEWKKKIDQLPPDTPKDKRPQEPWRAPPAGFTNGPRGDYYDKHIRPMQPFAIRGVLWDQGEGGTNIYGVDYDIVLRALIQSWRKDWGQGDFPFIFVQKPSGGGCAIHPDDPVNQGADTFVPLPKDPPQRYWDGNTRWQYVCLIQYPNTFMTITTDLATGVHPHNKSGYATRDARVALGAVYHQDIEYYGPLYQSFKVEGDQLRIEFTHTGQGLTVPEGQKLQGFTLAGADKKFHWADATIDGRTVVLSHPNVPHPVAARYAWSWDIRWANLFNKDGLPAIMFRTDSWWQ